MTESLCIFEDEYTSQLLPLVYMRPAWDLRCGITTLREKIQRSYPGAALHLQCRGYLAAFVQEQYPDVPVNAVHGDRCLFVNGCVLPDAQFVEQVSLQGSDAVYVAGNTLIAARVSGTALERFKKGLPGSLGLSLFEGLPRIDVKAKLVRYSWDLVGNNSAQLRVDFAVLTAQMTARIAGTVYDGAHLLNRDNICIEAGARVKPGVVLDAEEGPIFIARNAKIFPNAVIEGPAFVGEGSLIKIGAKIYEGTSIGPVCKVGGEVEESIIHSHSNKQHDGFLGHAYLAKWVNLGADTNNSDLKNNYGHVRVKVNGEEIDTGSTFVGVTMGDHAKSAINTMFNTGTVVGVSSNVFGGGFPSKYIPSFAWGGVESTETYDLDRSLDVARRVMGRRKIVMSAAEEAVFRKVFDVTQDERRKAGMKGS
jgi:UDP-N-acetylglucosamine diphosphorylase / glucose-1-phosphate thymidylyltransferase / UDP-N-acetylgalactosamine diphosphorylase / glucosamine-1-phosphate N-acetyltransferase / galactosamine-1-phosphate N-acetyltransferase